MHRTPLILALLLQAPAAAAQLHSTADSLASRAPDLPAPGVVVRVDSVPLAAVRTLPELLATRVPGVIVERSSGTLGAGSRLRLRGPNGMIGTNEPLVVVDGVRYVSGDHVLSINVGGQRPSRLDDLDPQDVESVRVLHGPAAAALYGSAGADGVIEVRTRRGESGPRVRAFAATGIRTDPVSYPANYARVGVQFGGARTTRCTLLFQADGGCTPKPDSLVSSNPLEEASPFRTGTMQTVGVSVGGAVPLASYYISADADRETGVLDPDRRERTDLRANLALRPFAGIALTATAGRRRGSLDLAPTDANEFNPIVDGLEASPLDPVGPDGFPLPWVGERTLTSTQDVVHTTFGIRGEWRPLPWLAAGASLGEDRLDRDELQEHRDATGGIAVQLSAGEERRLRTVGVDATASARIAGGLESTSLVGAERVTDRLGAFHRSEVPGGSSPGGVGTRFRGMTTGVYLRQQVGWRDRVHVEGSLRWDGATSESSSDPWWSTSLGAAWVIVRDGVAGGRGNEIRLRASHGSVAREIPLHSRRDSPCPVLTCGSARLTGGLDPEVVVETEAGVDAALLGGRLEVALTGYDRTTQNALAVTPISGGGGFTMAFRNVGDVRNRGVEAAIRADLVADARLRWSVDLTASLNRNRLEAEEDEYPVAVVGFEQVHRGGHPLGGYFARPILGFADRDGDGMIGLAGCPGPACEVQIGETREFQGSPIPTRLVALGSRLGLLGRIGVSARLEHQGGARLLNQTRVFRCWNLRNCREAYDPATPLEDQAEIVAWPLGTLAGFIEDADFVKLREVAVTLAIPAVLARRVGASGLDLTLAGRNLATWTGYSGSDPEVNGYGQAPFQRADLFTQPLTRQWTTRLDVRF